MEYVLPESYCDLTIKFIENTSDPDSHRSEIKIPKIFLWKKSMYFRMLCSRDPEIKSITIENFPRDAFNEVLNYITDNTLSPAYNRIGLYPYILQIFHFLQFQFKKGTILADLSGCVITQQLYDMFCDLVKWRSTSHGIERMNDDYLIMLAIGTLYQSYTIDRPDKMSKQVALTLLKKLGKDNNIYKTEHIIALFLKHGVELLAMEIPKDTYDYNNIIYYLFAVKKKLEIPITTEEKLFHFDVMTYPSIPIRTPILPEIPPSVVGGNFKILFKDASLFNN